MRSEHAQTALLIFLAAAAVLFACGLPGGFLLDDFPNLSNLERVKQGTIHAAIYVTEGSTGFPGRPLSYLTFFLQSKSWPDDPLAFKIVNIILHLVNGALVYEVARRLLVLMGQPQPMALGLLVAAVWLIHPIQVSTVLYVVQRMTELAALFSLCGILAYLRGRALASAGRIKPGYAWMTAALALGTPLAILAKENGVLLPVYIAVIEFTLLARLARPPRWGLWAAVFLAVPPLGVAAYLLLAPGWLDAYGTFRGFTLSERIHTEAGILWDYLAKIALPRPRAFGLYFDDYPVAAPPWVSFATAAALAAWCLVLAGALFLRRRLPVVSFAILWFLAGHLLESTVLPLELYFEHRNYLPLFGPALALAWGAHRLWNAASSQRVRIAYASLGTGAIVALAAVTWVEARTWGNPVRQVTVWASERPTSPRAQYALGMQYLFAGRYAEASETLAQAHAMAPQENYFDVARFFIGCLSDDAPIPATGDVVHQLATNAMRPVVINVLENLVIQLEDGTCRRINADDALAVLDGLLANPRITGQDRWGGLYLKGRLHAVKGELDPAMSSLEAADEILANLGVFHLQVMWLASAGLYDDAMQFIEKGRGDRRWRPWQRILYAPFFDAWEQQVRDAARAKGLTLREGR